MEIQKVKVSDIKNKILQHTNIEISKNTLTELLNIFNNYRLPLTENNYKVYYDEEYFKQFINFVNEKCKVIKYHLKIYKYRRENFKEIIYNNIEQYDRRNNK